MAMTTEQRNVIKKFLSENYQPREEALAGSGMDWMVDLILKTKAAQKIELIEWIDAERLKTTNYKSTLDVEKTRVEAQCDASVALLDSTKALL
jgi:hypothetical protein